ncbi:uncharacterized protein LOC143024857 isoform X2 [Oratosquilla oratoria]|uniref:uncharacterized protein LOC143024857 isoform X2 n=1 Tax=Oratosquilla oratoria TaxID=337810 RepID=UPI003F775B95
MVSSATMRAVLVVLVSFGLLSTTAAAAARFQHNSWAARAKRVSDQRLAELETLLYLHKLHQQRNNVPVAFGLVDINKIGRRRREAPPSSEEAPLTGLDVMAANGGHPNQEEEEEEHSTVSEQLLRSTFGNTA